MKLHFCLLFGFNIKADMASWNRQRNMLHSISRIRISELHGQKFEQDILTQIKLFVKQQKKKA